MSKENKQKLTNQDLRELVAMQEHPGYQVFIQHIDQLLDEANRLTVIPQKVPDAEIVFSVRLAQARISIYNGLIGFMKEAKIRLNNRKEENDG